MKEHVDYHLHMEGDIIVLTDIKTGRSITNGAAWVIADLADFIGLTFDQYRIIYRDTMDMYDGLAHRGRKFLGFVPIGTKSRDEAINFARNAENWPR